MLKILYIVVIYLRFYFDDLLASLDDDRLVGKDALEVVEHFHGLASPEIGIGVLVVPNQGALFRLDVRTVGRLGVEIHHWLRHLFPPEIRRQVARFPVRFPIPPITHQSH